MNKIVHETGDLSVSEDKKKKEIQVLVDKALSGKVPIFLQEKDGLPHWDRDLIRSGGGSCSDVLKSLTGTTDYDLAVSIFDRARFAMPGNDSTKIANVTLQALAEGEAKDATEARLIAQQSALYSQGMNYLSRADTCDMIPQTEFCLKNAVKLLRLHNETVEALGKYRRGGEQKVIVQHVNVEGGARAIVNCGNMVAGVRG